MAITPNKAQIEAAGLEYVEPHEIVKDTGPKALNLLAQSVVDLMTKGGVDEAEVRAIVEDAGIGGYPVQRMNISRATTIDPTSLGWPSDEVVTLVLSNPGGHSVSSAAGELPKAAGVATFVWMWDGQSWQWAGPVQWGVATPPDPAKWYPRPVTYDVGARSYTVPSDDGATYTVDGVAKAAGTYPVGSGTSATTVTWAAVPKGGYAFASDATKSGTFSFPAKTYTAGMVVSSDDFSDRADGSALAGSTTNLFAGGDAITYGQTTGVSIIASSGAMVTSDTTPGKFSFHDERLPVSLDKFIFEVSGRNNDGTGGASVEFTLDTGDVITLTAFGGYASARGATSGGIYTESWPDTDPVRLTYANAADGGPATITVTNAKTGASAKPLGEVAVSGKLVSMRFVLRDGLRALDSWKLTVG